MASIIPSGVAPSLESPMLRIQAVEELLFEDVARLRAPADDAAERRRQLSKARDRSLLVAVLDWVAIAVLFLWRDPLADFLTLGPTEETIFTVAILAVAVHSGFRLGQRERYRAVAEALRSLERFC